MPNEDDMKRSQPFEFQEEFLKKLSRDTQKNILFPFRYSNKFPEELEKQDG